VAAAKSDAPVKSRGPRANAAKKRAAPKQASPERIAAAEAKLAKLKADVEDKEEKSRRASASGGLLGIRAGTAAYERRRRALAKASNQADAALNTAREKLKEHQKLLNDMKGIKEKPKAPAPAPAPKPKGKERSRLSKIRDVLDKLNAKGEKIIAEHGEGSKEYNAYVSRYRSIFEKLEEEKRKILYSS